MLIDELYTISVIVFRPWSDNKVGGCRIMGRIETLHFKLYQDKHNFPWTIGSDYADNKVFF